MIQIDCIMRYNLTYEKNIYNTSFQCIDCCNTIYTTCAEWRYPKPLADALFFVITVYAATIVVISSYRVGRVIFNRENNKILSTGFFYALIGFMFLSLATLGYLDYVKGFKPVSIVISLLVLVISFVILPMLVARKNTSLLKMISRVSREFWYCIGELQ